MFKKHALQVQVIKQPIIGTATPEQPQTLSPQDINEIAKDQIQAIAVGVGAALIVGFMASATKEVIVHSAKTKIK